MQQKPRKTSGACLSEEALEEGPGQHVPGNGVSDGSEDPVQLPQRGFAVSLLAGDAVNQLLGETLLAHQAPRAEPAQGHLHCGYVMVLLRHYPVVFAPHFWYLQ